jgi:hypothetical protein
MVYHAQLTRRRLPNVRRHLPRNVNRAISHDPCWVLLNVARRLLVGERSSTMAVCRGVPDVTVGTGELREGWPLTSDEAASLVGNER